MNIKVEIKTTIKIFWNFLLSPLSFHSGWTPQLKLYVIFLGIDVLCPWKLRVDDKVLFQGKLATRYYLLTCCSTYCISRYEGEHCLVCQDFGYQIYATLLSFYIPLAVMIFVYYKIFRAARKIVLEERRAQSHLDTSHCYLEIRYNTRQCQPFDFLQIYL